MCASLVSCGSQEGQFTLYTQEEHLASVANTIYATQIHYISDLLFAQVNIIDTMFQFNITETGVMKAKRRIA